MPSIVTERIISPPISNGGIASSSSRRPQSAPAPVGPQSLCDVKPRKSQPIACTSTGRCGTACAASTTMIAPCSCAHAVSRSTGLIVPSVFEIQFAATTLIRPAAASSSSDSSTQLAAVVDRDRPELGPRPLRDLLPRHEVRVVLELRDHDDVARAEVVEAPGVRDEVEALRHVPREDDLPCRRRVDERAHLLARALVAGRRPLREVVDPAVDVRVGVLVELAHGVEHRHVASASSKRSRGRRAACRARAARRRGSPRGGARRRASGWR